MPRKILINTNNSIGTFITKVNTLSDYFGDMDDLSLKFDSLNRDSNLVSAINLLDSQIGNMALLDSIGFLDSSRYDLVAALNSISATLYGGERELFASNVHAGLDSTGELDILKESGGAFEQAGWLQNGVANVDSVSYIENLYTENFYADSMQVGQWITISSDDSGGSKMESRAPTDKFTVGANGGELELSGDSGVNIVGPTLNFYTDSSGGVPVISADSAAVTLNKPLKTPYPSFIGNVQDIVDSGFVNQGEFINTVFHSGNGVVNVPDSGYAKGSLITIRTIGTMTINWGDSAQGISLGSATKLASGIWDSNNWYFSETVV
jgi:hypothetical protein